MSSQDQPRRTVPSRVVNAYRPGAPQSLTASGGYQRRDRNGVVIGPWSDSARRAVAAQRRVRMARRGARF